jgi:hypothetical protein
MDIGSLRQIGIERITTAVVAVLAGILPDRTGYSPIKVGLLNSATL